MHTHAQPVNTTVCEYTGVLQHPAEVRTKVVGSEGYSVPVLCMDLVLDNTVHTHTRVEQNFPAGCHSQCEAAARRYKKGDRITVHAPLADLRLVLPNASQIDVIPDPSRDLETQLF